MKYKVELLDKGSKFIQLGDYDGPISRILKMFPFKADQFQKARLIPMGNYVVDDMTPRLEIHVYRSFVPSVFLTPIFP